MKGEEGKMFGCWLWDGENGYDDCLCEHRRESRRLILRCGRRLMELVEFEQVIFLILIDLNIITDEKSDYCNKLSNF